MQLLVFTNSFSQHKVTHCRCCVFVRMVLQQSNHQQRFKELTISQTCITLNILASIKCFIITTNYSQYFTATILEWKHLLKPDKYKDVIIDSLKFLVKRKTCRSKCLCTYEQPHTFDMANPKWL